MKRLSVDEYVLALEKMKRGTRDRIGVLGELGVTGLGLTAGVAVSGSIAAGAGAATLAGSTTLASILGGIFVTTTPVGWIVGSAAVGGCLAYSVGKLVRSGGKCDALKKLSILELEQRINSMRLEAQSTPAHKVKIQKVITSIQCLVANSHMEQNKATDIIEAIEKQRIDCDEAFALLQAIVNEKIGM